MPYNFTLFPTQAGGDYNEDDTVQVMKLRKTLVHDSIDTLMTYPISEKFVV